MDYGYQVLRHTIAQVFGNLGTAARITLVLPIIPLFILLVTNPVILTGAVSRFDNEIWRAEASGIGVVGVILAGLSAIVCWLWAAVAWHRFVLMEEYPSGLFPNWRGSNIVNYFGNALLIGLVLLGVGIVAALVIGIVTAVLQSLSVAIALGFGLVFGFSWLATRIGLILPAAALGERLSMGESWRVTAPVSGQIILPIIVIAIASTILNQAIIAGFGEATQTMTPQGPQGQVTLSVPGVILSVAASWLQLLVNLALMTTLYGNLIEGRQLN